VHGGCDKEKKKKKNVHVFIFLANCLSANCKFVPQLMFFSIMFSAIFSPVITSKIYCRRVDEALFSVTGTTYLVIFQ
jgi:hypothetical protein